MQLCNLEYLNVFLFSLLVLFVFNWFSRFLYFTRVYLSLRKLSYDTFVGNHWSGSPTPPWYLVDLALSPLSTLSGRSKCGYSVIEGMPILIRYHRDVIVPCLSIIQLPPPSMRYEGLFRSLFCFPVFSFRLKTVRTSTGISAHFSLLCSDLRHTRQFLSSL